MAIEVISYPLRSIAFCLNDEASCDKNACYITRDRLRGFGKADSTKGLQTIMPNARTKGRMTKWTRVPSMERVRWSPSAGRQVNLISAVQIAYFPYTASLICTGKRPDMPSKAVFVNAMTTSSCCPSMNQLCPYAPPH